MFGEIVGIILAAFLPIDDELSLFDSISNPIKSHIHSLRSFYNFIVLRVVRKGFVGQWVRYSWSIAETDKVPGTFNTGAVISSAICNNDSNSCRMG